ncbi:peptidoglycan DD-metalloendopeptidase family protein [Culicoidibacter larvae]|uniref:LysM peptidoglycan-binding domain-containing protein n=1 Tax=Culicoidibacter larvae TaxID=2579976 RepID=A0A5R8QHD2_9FIRM|nr:peptidoglycan DD-metalloendopeptidase family protein [Culicoidibacter larvae]TLG77459.1 LysM peptidoglycan-binding domain-containing protein [Culicoidibacter larvae]
MILKEEHKQKTEFAIVIAAIAIVVALGILFSVLVLQNTTLLHAQSGSEVKVYEIYENGKKVGTVSDKENFTAYVWKEQSKNINETGKLYFGDSVQIMTNYVPVSALPEDNDRLYKEIMDQLTIEGTAYQVHLSNGNTFHVRSRQELLDEIERLKDMHAVKDVDQNDALAVAEAKSKMTLGVEYTLKETTINIEESLSGSDLTHYLLTSKPVADSTYDTKAGDTLATIAGKNEMSVVELLELNPGLNENTLVTPELEVNVTSLNQVLEFTKMETKTYTEEIPYEIEYKDDATMSSGEEKVEQQGQNGSAIVEYLVRTVNGEEVKTEQLSKVVVTEPVKEVRLRGTGSSASLNPGSPNLDPGNGRFIWPAAGIVTYEFMDPAYGGPHYGIDIDGETGDPIWAGDSGSVVQAGWNGAFGYSVMIDHGDGIQTRYAHLSAIYVNVGQSVSRGETIGAMGDTGLSFGSHLHFEVHIYGERVNPRPYLP